MSLITKLEELYAQVPVIDCLGKCHRSCGPVDMTTTEHDRIKEAGVTIERHSVVQIIAFATGIGETPTCPALGMLRQCTVYPIRPLICRLWGVTESMPCPWNCPAERVLSDVEANELIRQAAELDGSTNWVDMRAKFRAAAPILAPLVERYLAGDQDAGKKLEAAMEAIDTG